MASKIQRLLGHTHVDCAVCGTARVPTLEVGRAGQDSGEQDCPRCGRFRITGTGLATVRAIQDRRPRTKLSYYIRRQNDIGGVVPTLTSDEVLAVGESVEPGVEERGETVFAHMVAKSDCLGAVIGVSDPGLEGAASSQIGEMQAGGMCSTETVWLLEMLASRGWISHAELNYEVSPKGYSSWEELSDRHVRPRQAFVAMPFAQPLSDLIRDGISRGLRSSGYEPFIVSDEEHIGKIDDLIVSSLRTARVLVSDLTYHRQNVYWEAGFCFGKGTPVFFTCHQDSIAATHFDIRQYNAVVWGTADQLATQLSRRIEAVIGRGPLDPPR